LILIVQFKYKSSYLETLIDWGISRAQGIKQNDKYNISSLMQLYYYLYQHIKQFK